MATAFAAVAPAHLQKSVIIFAKSLRFYRTHHLSSLPGTTAVFRTARITVRFNTIRQQHEHRYARAGVRIGDARSNAAPRTLELKQLLIEYRIPASAIRGFQAQTISMLSAQRWHASLLVFSTPEPGIR